MIPFPVNCQKSELPQKTKGGSDGKESATVQEARVQSLGREDPWRSEWQPTLVLLPGKSHGQRNLVGYS